MTPGTGTDAWPREMRYRQGERLLEIDFDTGETFALPAELLRVESPSAEVQGHGSQGKTIVAGKQEIAITAIDRIGHYAVRLTFSDGHDTGLFSWATLYRMGREKEALWQGYLNALQARGLRRQS